MDLRGLSDGRTLRSSPKSTSVGSGLSEEQFEYPVEMCIRNTFIDCKEPRSPELDGFFKQRLIRSCPNSGIEGKDDENSEATKDSNGASITGKNTQAVASTSAGSSNLADDHLDELEEEVASELSFAERAMKRWNVDDCDDIPESPQASNPAVLSLGSLIPQNSAEGFESADDVSTQPKELMSKGSRLHAAGKCKPCAFFHTKGCVADANCEFCHECAPGEKKLRRKERQEARKIRNYVRMASEVAVVHVPVPVPMATYQAIQAAGYPPQPYFYYA